ncbi:MAG TPA: FG-GAP repeat protein [Planctomycetota bacterium]|nr:FG-GAP repeat protein [Planctomycetota bacterium]
MKTASGSAPLSLAAALILAAAAAAQFPPTESAVLAPALGEFAGQTVALHGDIAFVGAPGGQLVGTPRFVHAYRFDGARWVLEQTLAAPAFDEARFGFALDFDGTTLVVGSPALPAGGTGRATVYTHDGASWIGTDLSYPPTSDPNLAFGHAVSVDGDSILVGAPLSQVFGVGENAGAVYSYRRQASGVWQIKQQVLPSRSSPDQGFGLALDISGAEALIGSSNGDQVHAFRFALPTQWSEVQLLTPSLATPDSRFGQALSMSGGRAVIGAWQDHSLPEGGAAFVFELGCGQWLERQKLTALAPNSVYGRTVGVDGDAVIVGATSEDLPGVESAGAAYVYRWDGVSYGLEQHLTASAPVANQALGRSVVVSGDRALVGAPGASSLVDGSAFVFDAVPVAGPWTDLGFALAGAAAPELRGTGTLQPSTPLELGVDCGLPGAGGVLFAGVLEIHAPFKGGVLVPQPLLQVGLLLDGGGGRTLATTWPANVPAGASIVLQAWMLDAGAPAGLSATNALRATAMP